VISGLQRSIGIVDELDPVALKVANLRLEIRHLEVGEGVIGGARSAPEDREFCPAAAPKTD
jgi:hypothetical protein